MEHLLVNLPVSIAKQGRRFVAYSPALDISTSGKSETDAKRMFGELARLFIEELKEAGTLDQVLTELGWRKITTRPCASQWTPPRAYSVPVRMPVAA